MLKIICIIPTKCADTSLPLLNRCLKSLHASAKLANVIIKPILVSDFKDHKRSDIKERYSEFNYVGEQKGFAKVNNMMIKKTINQKFDYYLIINDDAWIDKNFFKNAKELINKQHPDVVVPLIYERVGKKIDSFGIEYFKSGYAKNSRLLSTETQLGAMACLLVSKQIMQKMKESYGMYLNEILFSYFDDVEFSIRARGLMAKYVKNKSMIAHHYGSYSYGKKSLKVMYLSYRNLIWVILMTWPLKNICKHLFSILFVQSWTIYYGSKRNGLTLYIKYLWETLVNIKEIMAIRKRVISNYDKRFDFETTLSKVAFRTYHNMTL